jgi:hypothetical protein
MSRGRQVVTFQGLLQEDVLGTFRVIRGFATLADPALVSESMPYDPDQGVGVTGYQRRVDEQHIRDLKAFLTRGRYRFFPEIVLGLRSSGADDIVVSYSKRHRAPGDGAHTVRVRLKALRQSNPKRIWRIDGNHRLEAARQLDQEQRRSSASAAPMAAPFCFVVLDPSDPAQCELDEAMLFNLLNSKALPLVSEHSLGVLMRDNGSPAERFGEDRQVYLTRAIRDKVQGWPNSFYGAMGDAPLSRLHATAGVLLRPGSVVFGDRDALQRGTDEVFAALHDLASRLRGAHERFVLSYAFLPVAAEVYGRHTAPVGAGAALPNQQERVSRAERWLAEFAEWFDRVGGADLPMPADPSVLWTVFKREYDRRAGQVFIAMSFREDRTLQSIRQAMDEALVLFNQEHGDAQLAPRRIDEQMGQSYEIPARVFAEIAASRLMIADLTDEKPNVYCEVGYAMSKGVPFILTFHKTAAGPLAPWDRTTDTGSKVHFDLAAFRRIEYDNPMDLRDRLKLELDAWHDSQ